MLLDMVNRVFVFIKNVVATTITTITTIAELFVQGSLVLLDLASVNPIIDPCLDDWG
jgi:hypothetical protein